jgi:hypothetical protein
MDLGGGPCRGPPPTEAPRPGHGGRWPRRAHPRPPHAAENPGPTPRAPDCPRLRSPAVERRAGAGGGRRCDGNSRRLIPAPSGRPSRRRPPSGERTATAPVRRRHGGAESPRPRAGGPAGDGSSGHPRPGRGTRAPSRRAAPAGCRREPSVTARLAAGERRKADGRPPFRVRRRIEGPAMPPHPSPSRRTAPSPPAGRQGTRPPAPAPRFRPRPNCTSTATAPG